MRRVIVILVILITLIIAGCSQTPEEIGKKTPSTPETDASEIQIISSYNKTKVLVLNLSKELTSLEEGYGPTMNKEKPYKVEAGEPVILIEGRIRNKLDQKRDVWLYAYGYDSSGEQIAHSVGKGAPGTTTGTGVLVGLKGGEESAFRLVIKYDRNLSTVKIFAKVYKNPPT